MGKKPLATRKPATKRGQKTIRIVEVPIKKAARPRWVWAAAGMALVAVIVVWMLLPSGKEGTPGPPASSSSGAAGNAGGPAPLPPASPASGTAASSGPQTTQVPAAPGAPADTGIPEKQLAFIKAVRLLPSQPTRTDTLKAEVTAAAGAPERIAYTYQWKVNDAIVAGATGETLTLSALKKGDRVSVTVIPRDGDTAGFAVESPQLAVHPVAPSLEMKITRPASKIDDPVEVQLVSVAPDSERVTFSLEPPAVPGMTVDKSTGKVIWLRKPDQKGAFRFGAAVEDENRVKVTKVFEITVK